MGWYAAAGLRLTDAELPDHLAVMLEFAAANPGAGAALLVGHRVGLELLRLALREARSPWADVLDSVSATLPALGGDQRLAVARLAAQGPSRGAGRARAVRAAGVHAAAAGSTAMTATCPVVLAAGSDPDSALNVILWVVVPYVAIAVFVVGPSWRYRYDKFGWTTRSSQLYDRD